MAYIIQNNPITIQRDPSDPPTGRAVGVFNHITGTDTLFVTELVAGQVTYTPIAGVALGSTPQPPQNLARTLYHPTGTNRLYVKQDDGTWVNIAGLQPGGNDVIYYVDSVNGNDSTGTGSAQAPFQTFTFAYDQLPHDPAAVCVLRLIGAGPYQLPRDLNAVTPQRETGNPVMICGDLSSTPVYTGTVSIATDNTVSVNGTPFTSNGLRGFVYHGLTGTSAGKYYQISENSASTLYSIGNTFGAAGGDTFEILSWSTVLFRAGDFTINGPGKIGFWRCQLQYTNMNVTGTSVLFDTCNLIGQGSFTGESQSTCQFMATWESKDFSEIHRTSLADIGTKLGKVGAYFQTSVDNTPGAIKMSEASFGSGYIIAETGLETVGASRWELRGTYIDLSNTLKDVGIDIGSAGYLQIDSGSHVIGIEGGGYDGVRVHDGSFVQIVSSFVQILNCTHAGMVVQSGGVLRVGNVPSGSVTGNGVGILVERGGTLFNLGGNTLLGTLGDVQVYPNTTATPWAQVPFMLSSYPRGYDIHRTTVNNADYTATREDQLIAFNTTTTAPRTVTVPDPALTGASATYVKRVTVQSEVASSGTWPIGIVAAAGSINGNSVISAAYGSVTLYTTGTAWFVENRI